MTIKSPAESRRIPKDSPAFHRHLAPNASSFPRWLFTKLDQKNGIRRETSLRVRTFTVTWLHAPHVHTARTCSYSIVTHTRLAVSFSVSVDAAIARLLVGFVAGASAESPRARVEDVIARCCRHYALDYVHREGADRRTFVRRSRDAARSAWRAFDSLIRLKTGEKSCSRGATVSRTATSRRKRPTPRSITSAVGCTRERRRTITYSRKSYAAAASSLQR